MADKAEENQTQIVKRGRGQPTKKTAATAAIIRASVMSKMKHKDIAETLSIGERTLSRWKDKDSEIMAAFADGKEWAQKLALAMSMIALLRRAIGYTVEEEKLFCSEGEILRASVNTHYPPDVKAAQIIIAQTQRALGMKPNSSGEANLNDIMAEASALAFAELQRLKDKANTVGLTPEDHRSMKALMDGLIQVKETQIDISLKKREVAAKIPTEELEARAEEMLAELKAKKAQPVIEVPKSG